MARSTGPILVAGAITWANTVLLNDEEVEDIFTSSIEVALATGLAASLLYGIETFSGDLATALAWAALVTVLFVRVKPNNPTPLERVLKLM